MLQFLPLEILDQILLHVLYPVNYLGYYLDRDDYNRWSQQDGLNLSATCKVFRQAFTQRLWQHIYLDIAGENERQLSTGYRLFSETVDFQLPISFLNCSWKDESDDDSSTNRDMSIFLKNPNPMDPALNYVKIFKFGINESKLFPFQDHPEALNRYLSVINLVNPQTMPVLQDLIFGMVIHERTDKAHTDLGRVLGTFENRINLSLTANREVIPWNYRDGYSCIDLIYPFGLLPFVVDLHVRAVDCGEKASSQLMNVRGLKFDVLQEVRPQCKAAPSFITSASITYLDMRFLLPIGYDDEIYSQFDWIPPTVRVFKCSNHFFFFDYVFWGPVDEEKHFQLFDNVFSLTIECTEVLECSNPNNIKFPFRNLTELQVLCTDRDIEAADAGNFFHEVICGLLSSNEQSLVRLKLDYLYSNEFDLISTHFDLLETLEYNVNLYASDHETYAKFLSRAMSKWGPNLRQLYYQIEIVDYFYENPAPRPIDYGELRTQALSHPNLSFNAVQFVIPNPPPPIEITLFGNTFQESSDSKHFVFTDFCEIPDPKLFASVFSSGSYANIFIDFTKLRALINEVELKSSPQLVQ